jgi:hypothetical protein
MKKNCGNHCGMKTPSEIIEFVGGGDKVAAALGVGTDAVRMAVKKPQLPSAWLDTLEALARRPLPRELFAFKRATTQTAESSHPPAPSR